VTIEYVIEIPDSVASRFVNLINEQILTVPCFDSISCHTHIEIDKSDMAIVINIPISRGTDIEYSGYILSGIRKYLYSNIYVIICRYLYHNITI
jgi:hypothetical protein